MVLGGYALTLIPATVHTALGGVSVSEIVTATCNDMQCPGDMGCPGDIQHWRHGHPGQTRNGLMW